MKFENLLFMFIFPFALFQIADGTALPGTQSIINQQKQINYEMAEASHYCCLLLHEETMFISGFSTGSCEREKLSSLSTFKLYERDRQGV